MPAAPCFRLNQPAVIAEVVDHEAVIVNLDSGTYYSLRGLGEVIWDLLVQQELPVPVVVAAVTARYSGPATEIEAGVVAFIDELAAEKLIVPQTEPKTSEAGVPAPEVDERAPFEPPKLEKFTDMADLLLLDPIHEVDDTGWPNQPKPTAKP